MTIEPPIAAAPGGAPTLRTAGHWRRARLAALLCAAMERDARHHALRQLARMDDHLLRDIGLTRDAGRGRGRRP